jgi:hypothetical protein
MAVVLTADDLREIEETASKIKVQGARYPEDLMKRAPSQHRSSVGHGRTILSAELGRSAEDRKNRRAGVDNVR